MGIAGFSQSSAFAMLFAPFQSVCIWLNASSLRPHTGKTQSATNPPASLASSAAHRNRPVFSSRKFAPLRRPVVRIRGDAATSPLKSPSPGRLKIVREFDASAHPASAGRMVISGRMADVCAELERMAQKEMSSSHA